MRNLEESLIRLELNSLLSFDESFRLAQDCSGFLNESGKEGRRLLINVLDKWQYLHPATYEVWSDIIESAGFYPYLEKNKSSLAFKGTLGALRKELHRSDNLQSKFFHEEQLRLLKIFKEGRNLIVSAPTSFGKSLLIEEIIASEFFRNIVVIQPTLALLDETRKKMLRYRDRYKLIIRTSQEPSASLGNIFLFTAERVNEYNFFSKIDFLVIDEFYKLSGSRDDERSSSLNNAFYYLLKEHSPRFYLLGPNIDGISDGFAQQYNADFIKSEYTLVESKEINVFREYSGKFGVRGAGKQYKEKILFDLLISLAPQQTIIYCSSPQRVRYLSKEFTKYGVMNGLSPVSEQLPLVEWIESYIAKDWGVLLSLKNGIGIHDGALQKHISTSIIDYFNLGKLKYLFCTSTIIEGVNTSAKNIVYFDSKKGLKDVDYFDYSNIRGRSGRMMEHYVGNIYNFNPPPEYNPVIIDIPFFQQDPIADEILINIRDEEILYPDTPQYSDVFSIPTAERTLIKENGLVVKGQLGIISHFRSRIENDYAFIAWSNPSYRQLEYVLGVCWDYLIVPGESVRPMTKRRLIKLVFDYGVYKNINPLIVNTYNYLKGLDENASVSDGDMRDLAIQDTFQIMKHWFEYKVPKWLSVANEIQKFVCNENGRRSGNYLHYASQIENDFLRENLSILSEFGVPSSAIQKLEGSIPASLSQDEVLEYIRRYRLYESRDLLAYEKYKIVENLIE